MNIPGDSNKGSAFGGATPASRSLLKPSIIVGFCWLSAITVAYAADHGILSSLLGSPVWIILFLLAFLIGGSAFAIRRKEIAIVATSFAILGLGTFMVAKIWVHPLDILRLQAWRIFSWPPDVQVLVNGKNVSFNNWGESGFVGSIVSFTLVRDETREIALSHRSKEWTTFALPVLDRFAPPDCNSSIKNLSDVYYVVTTAC